MLVEKYDNERDQLTKSMMQLAISSGLSYEEITRMSYNERKIMLVVLQEKIDAENPKRSRQQLL